MTPAPAPPSVARPGAGAEREPLVITVPIPQLATNGRGSQSRHFRSIARAKRAYLDLLDGHVITGRIPRAPAEPITRASLTSVMHLGGAMDDDNAVARHKWPLDWLVSRGYLATDRRTGLRWAAFPEQVVSRKQAYTITLTITPLET